MGSAGTESRSCRYRIGVDVGGTNTDAVLVSLSPTRIITAHKAPTTTDVTTGITDAVNAVIRLSDVSLNSIDCVIIGTTHFVNAVVQRSPSLQRVGVVRLCGGRDDGFGLEVPPFVDFPRDLRRLISARTFFCHGGYQISGTEISPVDENGLQKVAEDLVKEGVFSIVISGIYSPLNAEHEMKAAAIISKRVNELSGPARPFRVTLSHQISSLGFLARENAAILNAALRPLAEKTIFGFQRSMENIFDGSSCALYLTQNDGSILSATDAIDLPIRTFNSGPTNSIRGGEFLWSAASIEAGSNMPPERQDPLVVIDIGGTTSDSGLLLPNGLPKMSSLTSFVGGVRTNFALPAVESIGLGGGSVVRTIGMDTAVGPDSVALELTQKARLFGGNVLTATDIVAASELHSPSGDNPLKGLGALAYLKDIPIDVLQRARQQMRSMIEGLVDRTKVQEGDVDVLIVGGGAILIDVDQPLSGIRAVRKVKGGEVANAVGAAISRVSEVVDTVVDTSNQTLRAAEEGVSQNAVEAVIKKGARKKTVQIAEVTVLPIQYVDAKARMVVRAVGELDAVQALKQAQAAEHNMPALFQQDRSQTPDVDVEADSSEFISPKDFQAYQPKVENGQWIISSTDLEWIASGCRVLGCGGGGDPYQQYLKVRAVLEKSPGSVKVVAPSKLAETATVGFTGMMGSPEVSMERMDADECNKAHDELTRVMGLPPVDAFMALEIGGGNGLVNFAVAAAHNVPCVDADYMGRAYPTYWQTTANVYGTAQGEALVPATIASGDGSFITMTSSKTDRLVDVILRAAVVEMGCGVGKAGPPKSAKVVQQQAVANTVSLAWWIGRAIALEKNVADRAARVVEVVGGFKSAKILAEGKITRVERILKTGHTYGVVEVDGVLTDGSKATVRIPFKNENAFVEAKAADDGETTILASVPDLVVVLDSETGQGLGTPEYKYGLKVIVLAIAASPRWTDTPRGLALGGPASMGFDEIEYCPIGEYTRPRSVIQAYS